VATESQVSGGTFAQGLGNNAGNRTNNIAGTATYTWLDTRRLHPGDRA
jgi:hypothetical protein